jgi:hypothetical protein
VKRTTFSFGWARGFVFQLGLLAPLAGVLWFSPDARAAATPTATPTALPIQLRDAELSAAGSLVLQNGTGTVRLEDGRLSRLAPSVFAMSATPTAHSASAPSPRRPVEIALTWVVLPLFKAA